MAYHNNFNQQTPRLSSKREAIYLPDSDSDSNLKLKTFENSINIFHKVMSTFNDIEANASSKNLMRGMADIALRNPKDAHQTALGQKDKIFTYFVLSVSIDEFQKIIDKFCQDFSTQKDLKMTEHGFKRMLAFFCKKENIGRAKMEKLLKKLVPSTFETCERLDKALGKHEENELGAYLTKELFQMLKDETFTAKQEDHIDHIKLLPLLLGLYSKLISLKVTKKMRKLEMIMGIDNKGKKIVTSEPSLYEKFEKIGKIIEKKRPVTLKYKDIQTVLEDFQNSSLLNLGQQHKDLVLQDLQAKYKYSKKKEEFLKPPTYTAKFLIYLASRICVRGIKSIDQHAILQELIEWNIVIHAEKLDSEKLSKRFLIFAEKRVDINKPIPLKSLEEIFSAFVIKIIPTIQKKIMDNALMEYLEGLTNEQELKILDFSERINILLLEQANLKLQTYFKFNYGLLDEHILPIESASISPKTATFRGPLSNNTEDNLESKIERSNVQTPSLSRPMNGYISSINSISSKEVSPLSLTINTSPKFEVPEEIRNKLNNKNLKSQEEIASVSFQKPPTINAQEHTQKKPRTRGSLGQVVSGSQTTKATSKKMGMDFISLENTPRRSNFSREERKERATDGRPRTQQDYLNACFVNEALSGINQISKQPNVEVGVKKRASKNKQIAKQHQEVDDSDITKETCSRLDGLSEEDRSTRSPDHYTPLELSRVELNISPPPKNMPKFTDFMQEFKKKKEEECVLKISKQEKTLDGENNIIKDRAFCECNLM